MKIKSQVPVLQQTLISVYLKFKKKINKIYNILYEYFSCENLNFIWYICQKPMYKLKLSNQDSYLQKYLCVKVSMPKKANDIN